VGKTALALQWAHQVTGRFPDGQLYVNLRGYDADEPVPATDALAGFLRALGVDDAAIPPDPAERAAQYRSLLAGRRMLVLLDNAREAHQVRPLLPGSGGCVVLVTSRESLAGLVARDGAVRLELDVLPPVEARALLRSLIGARVDAEPGPAGNLAALCCRLPLALRIAAELATAHPTTPLADLVRELDDQRRRLDLLAAGGDSRTDVRSVFSWSYRHLAPPAARAFRLVGLHPGSDFDTYATAALTGTTVEQAGRLLDQLCRAHLVQRCGPGRYGMHDLLRAYARELADIGDEPDRRAALTALFDHYRYTASCAVDVLFPAGAGQRPRLSRPADPVPPVDDEPAAHAWLDAERANLAAVATRAAGHGLPRYAVDLSAALFWYLDYGSHLSEAYAVHSSAAQAAAQIQDRTAQAHTLVNLGGVALRQSRNRQAVDHYRQALALCRESGDRFGELRALGSLAAVDQREGRYEPAADHYRQVLDLCRELGIRSHESRALACLGQLDLLRGRYDRAAVHLEQSVALCHEIGDHNSRADALVGLAEVDLHQGRCERARTRLEEARAVFRDTGNRASDAHAVYYLGVLELRGGDLQQAASLLRQARTAFHDSGDRADEAHALCRLGELDARLGRRQQAVDQLQQALDLCRETGDRTGQAQALNALGEVLLAVSPREAVDRHRDAMSVAVGTGAIDEQTRARDGLARARAALGRQ
jgi:tetratricopeptide (TPR) repeat protein